MHVQEAFKADKVLCEGKLVPQSYRVQLGETLTLLLPPRAETVVEPKAMPLDIVFEDADIIVLNKAPGQIVHPGNGNEPETLVHGLLHHTGGQLSLAGGEKRPGVVHRLDKETSGLMVFAKTDKAYFGLIEAFANREVQKVYTAIVDKVPRLLSGRLNAPIGRHPVQRTRMAVVENGSEACTDWELIEKGEHYARLKIWLHTGRTHQIRVHLSHIGHILVGDVGYGWRPRAHTPPAGRVFLHAMELGFMHPVTGASLSFKAPVPEDMKLFMKSIIV
jgi:23S rRNA pseudouridine1911/1915/1917 synthase